MRFVRSTLPYSRSLRCLQAPPAVEDEKVLRFWDTTDSEIGAMDELDKVKKVVSNLQHQVLTLGLERESVRRLEELRRTNSVSQSQELYHDHADGQAVDFCSMPQQ